MSFSRNWKVLCCFGVIASLWVFSVCSMEADTKEVLRGGGSGFFKPLPGFTAPEGTGLATDPTAPFIPQRPSGVKIFKKDMTADVKIELAVWKQVKDNYNNFVKGLSKPTTTIPDWWKTDLPISTFMLQKNDNIDKEVVKKIEENIKNVVETEEKRVAEINNKTMDQYYKDVNEKSDLQKNKQLNDNDQKKLQKLIKQTAQEPMPLLPACNTDAPWLLMENLQKATPQVIGKVIADETKKMVIDFAQEVFDQSGLGSLPEKISLNNFTLEIEKKIGEAILLMAFLGVTVEDSDICVTYKPGTAKDQSLLEAINRVTVKFIDFGESAVFATYLPDGKINPVTETAYTASLETASGQNQSSLESIPALGLYLLSRKVLVDDDPDHKMSNFSFITYYLSYISWFDSLVKYKSPDAFQFFTPEVKLHLRTIYDAVMKLENMKPLQELQYDQSIKKALSAKS